MPYRIGIGYDIHRLARGRKLILGGIEIPYAKGLLGHSDADALIHAIIDALLGAAGSGDIGAHFPDTDSRYKDISSEELLKKIAKLLRKKSLTINNIDTIIIAEEPLLAPFKEKMRRKIARILKIRESKVNIKAKTNEGLSEIGAKKAIAAYAAAVVS